MAFTLGVPHCRAPECITPSFRRIRQLYEAINRGDVQTVLDAFSAGAEHVFIGEGHALAGRRDNPASIRDWYGRLQALLPDLRFTPHRIDVAGASWSTLAVVEWTEANRGTDGVRTETAGVHVVHLRWGRMRRLLILSDTAALAATLRCMAESGNGLSLAAPIDDRPGWPVDEKPAGQNSDS